MAGLNWTSLLSVIAGIALAPLLPGIISRVKARFAGRRGAPVFQLYFDLWKLWRKGAVYSRTTSWLFRAGPVAGLAAAAVALLVLPFGSVPAPLAFAGDLILLAGMLGLMRFMTIVAALDTGSSFEGMGASREAFFSALAEPALLLALGALARVTDAYSLSTMYGALSFGHWWSLGPVLALTAAALVIVLLAENARIPVDDPNTHLELTMIHEVMVLDHGGPDFAAIQYGAALKLWIFSTLLASLLLPVETGMPALDFACTLAGVFGVAALVGIVESVMARLRMVLIPQLLVSASVLAAVALLLTLNPVETKAGRPAFKAAQAGELQRTDSAPAQKADGIDKPTR